MADSDVKQVTVTDPRTGDVRVIPAELKQRYQGLGWELQAASKSNK
jgi:hypothetical protein